jgi:hypothetical protein
MEVSKNLEHMMQRFRASRKSDMEKLGIILSYLCKFHRANVL